MIEFPYAECTTSVITSFSIFKKYYSDYRRAEIEQVFPFRSEHGFNE